MQSRRERLKRWIGSLIALLLLGLAFEALHGELSEVRWADVSAALRGVPASAVLAALLATLVNFAALSFYDRIAFAYIGKHLPYRRLAYTSFLAYAIANSIGFATLSGTSVRYRYYSRWGVTAGDLSRVVINYSTTFWLGLFALGGMALVLHPAEGAARALAPFVSRAVGSALLALVLGYIALPFLRRQPLRFWRFELAVPSTGIVLAQVAASVVDWMACAAVLYVLLPASALPFGALLGSFLVAQLAGLVSHVPGGIGVFESLMLIALRPYHAPQVVLAALLLFRVIYYLAPFAIAVALILRDELRQRRQALRRVFTGLTTVSEAVTPHLLAVLTFAAGCLLLLSGATPVEPGRLRWLSRAVPLPALEASHFLASLAGVGLLLLANAVRRRIREAYLLTTGLLVAGVGAVLVRSLDYEAAVVLALLLAALVVSRAWFDRRAALFAAPFSPEWIASIVGALAATLWLGRFAFRHVEYAHELWWQFEFDGEASRFLRASVGACVTLLVFAGRRLLTPAPPEVALPDETELAAAERIVMAQPSPEACLVLLGDKALIFDEGRSGFVMYGVHGRTWVAMGDPVVSDPSVRRALVSRFLDRCDDFGGRPVFYEVSKEQLHLYADFGLMFAKLGETARVPLHDFSLDGGERKALRAAYRRVSADGGTFRVVFPPEVDALLAELEDVSREWLREKATAEKGFSLGAFSPDYLRRLPVAVVERAGRIEAFANIWRAGGTRELSVDLMRHRASPIRPLMDGLFAHLFVWGRANGYEYFNLGMAPLSGLEESPLAPLWARLANVVFAHGERFYNFQGLRAYKEKFRPIWEPRYLAYPGRLTLAPVLADISALVAGGYRRMLFKP